MSQFPTCEHGLMLNDVYPCEKCEKNRAEKQRLTSLVKAVNENYEARIAALEAERDAMLERIGRVLKWCETYGASLCPNGWSDSFGDGMRAAKGQVRRIMGGKSE